MKTIKVWGDALGNPTEHDNKFIQEFLPDIGDTGLLTTTEHSNDAMQFESFEAAFEFWRQISKRRPLRPDGKPNRPLTAYNVEIG